MEIFQMVTTFGLWLLVIPFCVGIIPAVALGEKRKAPSTVFLTGWILMLALFQVCAVPCVLLRKTLTDLDFMYTVMLGLLSMIGVIIVAIELTRKNVTDCFAFSNTKNSSKEEWLTWSLFAVLFVFQMVMAVIYMTPDGDDAYYVTHAVMADEFDSMYVMEPYTGVVGVLDQRHVLAPFPMFIALLARKSGLHAAAVAHTILPLVLIPLTYLTFYKLGKAFWKKEEKKLSVYMVLIAMVQMFGGSSVYTNETFFLTRTWQGKSLLANLILPMALYILFMICKKTERGKRIPKGSVSGWYILLFLVNMTGALASSLGLLLLLILEGGFLLLIALRNRHPWVVFAGVGSALPCFLFILLYVLL